jgi:acetolactate synthase I/II/III large subunit
MVKLSDYIVARIHEITGTDCTFMLSGGMAMHLIESFGNRPGMKVVPCHHEQAAGIAASAYGRVTGKPGILLVTAGPGALNAVTPCGGAWMESVPLVIVSGQVSRANSRQGHAVRQRGIQEVEIVDVVKSITKYAVKIEDPATARYHIEKGLAAMNDGRPGPVWFDIPVDVQAATIDPESQRGFAAEARESSPPVGSVKSVVEALSAAKRPMLVLGHGVRLSGAADVAERLVDKLGIPFQTSWNGMDLVDDGHSLYAGRAGVFAARYANMAIQNADYVLAIGCRLGIQHTGYNVEGFCRGARLAVVDVDREEMDKPGLSPDDRIVADARVFIDALLGEDFSLPKHESWIAHIKMLKEKFPPVPTLPEVAGSPFVEPKYFISRLSRKLQPNAIFMIGSSGMGHTISGGFFECRRGQRVFTFKGLAAMGYGLPAAVGAGMAGGARPVYTIIGEGGLQLNLQELQTIRHFGLKTKVIVVNNGGYHSIHMTQKAFFDGHFVASGPESGVSFPKLEGLAELYGMGYFSARLNEDVDAAIDAFIASERAVFLEVYVDPDKAIEPRIPSMRLADGTMVSRPLDDMAPLLDREEFARLMFFPPIEGD